MPGHTRVSKFEAASRVVVGEPRAERSSSDLVMSARKSRISSCIDELIIYIYIIERILEGACLKRQNNI